MFHRSALAIALLAGCPPPAAQDTQVVVDSDTDIVDTDPPPRSARVPVLVTLDGTPVQGALVAQGGVNTLFTTGPDGRVEAVMDLTIDGEWVLHASHPQARIAAAFLREIDGSEVLIELTRFSLADNLEYEFQDPGTDIRFGDTSMCAHCHRTLVADWVASPHSTSAANPEVHDLYAGVASVFASESTCVDAGGTWAPGIGPGTGAAAERCYLGTGVLPELDPSCAPNCDGKSASFGGCADCHAPGIDGELGGRDLLAATGFAHDYGVHCDVCHKVESVDLDNPDPGVAGRLVVLRPSEIPEIQLAGKWAPLQFGPHHDVSNPRMGSVQRDHFETGQICAGCHQLDQASLLPDVTLDTTRWPDARIPVHSTWAEWSASPFADKVPCNACHMPPAPEVTNSADLQMIDITPGLAGGWVRPPGAIRHHSWIGPRTASSDMLQLAAALDIDVSRSAGVLEARVTTTNVGAGHRLPTGEPSRAVVLRVEARCDDEALEPIGGEVVPTFVGTKASKGATGDWTRWPQAEIGDTVRVVTRGAWYDLDGHGPFGDGTFTPAQKGLRRWELVGIRTITAIDAGVATFDAALPAGDQAWLGPPLALSDAPGRAGMDAGAPGFAFARVLAGPDGPLMVPHHGAVDVVSDNRLAPHRALTTTHRFAAPCEAPTVTARLSWRAYPAWLAEQKSWDNPEIIMAEVTR